MRLQVFATGSERDKDLFVSFQIVDVRQKTLDCLTGERHKFVAYQVGMPNSVQISKTAR